jgi:DNA-directed RNA polymerase subunit K/omega
MKIGLNRYEAVIVAAKHARHLNKKRLQALEQMEENPTIELDPRKISMVAITELLDGKVKFLRPDSM